MLKIRIVTTMNSSGNSATHGARTMSARASESIEPHDGLGGWMRAHEAENWRRFVDANGAEVLRLRAAPAGEYQDRYEENYVLIGQSGTKTFYARVSAQKGDSYYLEPESLAERFSATKS